MNSKSLAARLAALEALEATEQAEPTEADMHAWWLEADRRLAPLGLSLLAWQLGRCGACSHLFEQVYPRHAPIGCPPCPVCGRSNGSQWDEQARRFMARVACPACSHEWRIGERAPVAPCPSCGYCPPPVADVPAALAADVALACLVKRHGVAAARALCPDFGVETLEALTTWWFTDVQRDRAALRNVE